MNINEIAKLAGVSRATVSRYLNNGYVSEDKKISIQKVIEETGYQPSASAQTLRSKKTHIIGVIIPKINSDSISRMVSGISRVLTENGYQLLLACTENREQKELEYLTIFRENHVDGILLLGTIFTADHMAMLEQLSVPIVILGQNLNGYSCVYHDDYSAAYELTRTLLPTASSVGYLSANPNDVSVGKNRCNGFSDATKEAHFPEQNIFTDTCAFSTESGYEHAKALLADHPEIDTLICATDSLAVGAMMAVREAGRAIPSEVQVAGLNDSTLSKVTTPTLTTVHFFYEEAGEEAATILLDSLKKKNPDSSEPGKTLQLHYKLILQGSTRTLS